MWLKFSFFSVQADKNVLVALRGGVSREEDNFTFWLELRIFKASFVRFVFQVKKALQNVVSPALASSR